jgi:sigma-B regulation protein RsbU (phosphoserine phosphatase)
MKRGEISIKLDGFLQLQGLCVVPIIGVWAIFWAIDQTVNLPVVFAYVLIQVNLTFLFLKPLEFLYRDSKALFRWPAFLVVLFLVTSVAVILATAAAYWVDGAPGLFASYLRSAWKFPFVGNALFWTGHEIYRVTKCRLETRNRNLERTIEIATAERELETEELRQACEIQRGLLPKEIPQIAGFQMTGAWEPAKVVGGDYFDVIGIGKDKVAICIADVAGKGISAALLMANVQAAVRAFASEYLATSRVCAEINTVLCTNTAAEKFVTLFYGILDAQTRRLKFTNAGHLRPLLVRAQGETTHLENSGALLGVFPGWKYEDSEIELQPGDLLVLFTDGITEAMSPDGREFGEDNLITTVRQAPVQALDELQSHVLEAVKKFCNNRLSDDATLVLLAAPPVALGGRRAAKERADRPILEFAGERL